MDILLWSVMFHSLTIFFFLLYGTFDFIFEAFETLNGVGVWFYMLLYSSHIDCFASYALLSFSDTFQVGLVGGRVNC